MNDASLESLRQRLTRGAEPGLVAEINAAVAARRGERGQHRDWALLCEEAGLLSLAFSEFQLALRDDPDDPLAAFHLAQHYRERGDAERAISLLARLLDASPARMDWLRVYVEILCEDGAAPRAQAAIERAEQQGLPAAASRELRRLVSPRGAATGKGEEASRALPQELQPTDADCFRFCTLFSGREGVYARQWARPSGETGYTPVQEPLTPTVARNHMLGTYTVGAYPVRVDGTATFLALDLDIDKSALQRARGDHAYAEELREAMRREGPRLLGVLRELGLQPLFENSAYKGRHYWVFLDYPETADVLHLFGRLFVTWQAPQLPPGLHLEAFPKQGRLSGKGLGNLIKLPLGIHRRSGYRSQLLDDSGQPLADALAALRSARRTTREQLRVALDQLKRHAPAGGAAAEKAVDSRERAEEAVPPVGPAPPSLPAIWTEADFATDPRIAHLLAHCPTLADLKRAVNEHRRLTHEEQLVLIHSLGHLEGGPQAVNYLFQQCVDVGPEKLMKDRLKGNPVSCPSIRKKIPHVTRRLACNCPFPWAADRYPTPLLHLLTMPAEQDKPVGPPPPDATLAGVAQRFGVLQRRLAELQREAATLREQLVGAIRAMPERTLLCEGGRYRLLDREGVEELVWEEDAGEAARATTPREEPGGESGSAGSARLKGSPAAGPASQPDPVA